MNYIIHLALLWNSIQIVFVTIQSILHKKYMSTCGIRDIFVFNMILVFIRIRNVFTCVSFILYFNNSCGLLRFYKYFEYN